MFCFILTPSSITKTDDARDGEKSVSDQEQRYANCMNTLAELSKEFEAIDAQNQKTVNEYKAKLQEREEEASVKSKEFSQFKRKVTLEAINSRTGSSLPPKVVDQMDVTEQRKEAEVVAVRLENIKLRNRLKRDEQLLRQKVQFFFFKKIRVVSFIC